ncbi:MAG: hypothetical protein U1D30_03555 [Planctomycetota bacterium]
MTKLVVTNDEFLASAAGMERALITPCLVGELEFWIAEVVQATENMAQLLRVTSRDQIPDILEEIRNEDPELLQKVDEIEQEEQQLLNHFHRYWKEVRRISRSMGTAEAEIAFRMTVPLVVDLGLKFVVEARKLQASTLTLLLESIYRDRGVVD